MHYIIGDIHGCAKNLFGLFKKISGLFKQDDVLVFLGDYIDRGTHSYDVIDFLISLSKIRRTIFLKGNHEDMLLKYLNGEDIHGSYLLNGGQSTINSYKKNCGAFLLPDEHLSFFQNLKNYYEMDDFIAVHAGFNPNVYNIQDQSEMDTLWIREAFYRTEKRWDKTIIFGHTPTKYLGQNSWNVYFDEMKNIIGIDTGAVYRGLLTCITWPDLQVYQC